MGASTSCTSQGVSKECVQQAIGCPGDDLLDRKFLNVQLIAGARDGEVSVVREALKGGANVETRQPMKILAGSATASATVSMKAKRQTGPTPLMLAAKSGSVACVQALLACRAKVGAKDEDAMRPLHYAGLSGEVSVLQVLLDARANPGELDCDGRGVLEHLADEVRKDHLEIRRWRDALAAAPAPDKRKGKGQGQDQGGDASPTAAAELALSQAARRRCRAGGVEPAALAEEVAATEREEDLLSAQLAAAAGAEFGALLLDGAPGGLAGLADASPGGGLGGDDPELLAGHAFMGQRLSSGAVGDTGGSGGPVSPPGHSGSSGDGFPRKV